MTGYVHARAGGWPHMFRATEGPALHRDEAKYVTTRYYDVVNFARRVTVPGLYSWGFNDETCPPTSMYAAYNVITAPKRLMLAYDKGHQSTQEQVDDVNGWLGDELTGRTRHRPDDRALAGYFASGSGRNWKCAASGFVPLPPSISHGVRSPFAAQIPRPFQPAFGSSIRPSNPLA